MRKLTQNKVNQFNEFGVQIQRGNCYTTCIAMILGKNIDEVPKFEELPDDGSWFVNSWNYLNENGYLMDIKHVRDGESFPMEYSIASGPSPRGTWSHSVVYFDGKLYHDPYPNGNGISEVKYFLIIKKKE